MGSKKFSEILCAFLRDNHLTQTEFAVKVGVKQSQVSEWLKEKALPGYTILRQIAKAYDISADYWLDIKNSY